MKQNFRGDKRRKEMQRKKKQEEKRNKRLNKNASPALPESASSGFPATDAGASFPQDFQNKETL